LTCVPLCAAFGTSSEFVGTRDRAKLSFSSKMLFEIGLAVLTVKDFVF
jgi:hypothetical protein